MTNLALENTINLKAAEGDQYVPDDFYSTTNLKTYIYLNREWVEVKGQRMDGVIVVDDEGACCKKLRSIKRGDLVVCGEIGVKTIEPLESEEQDSFGFMCNGVSSERKNELVIKLLAKKLHEANKKVVIVAGPVIVHTGGDVYMSELIRRGYISTFLCGNAVAVHDIEKNMFGTSLGVCAKSGKSVHYGYKNHLRAINQILKYGSIRNAVAADALKAGIMYECVNKNVPFVLAGSLRDDGPLPDTITDMNKAQEAYFDHLRIADIVIVLGSMLHGIATGNMLPASVEMICVDINPAVVTKLSDRGSGQASGVITDVGLFLNLLVRELDELN